MKADDLENPTKAGIAALFKELSYERRYAGDDPEIQAVQSQYEQLEQRLLNYGKLNALKNKIERLTDAFNKKKKKLEDKVRKVRRLYYAHGLTANVKKAIQNLVKECNDSD